MTEPATPPVPPVPPVADPTPPAPPTPPVPPTPPAPTETTDETIARLQAEVKAARAEAGKERITAKQNAADEARAELAKTLGTALGLIEDDAADPAKLLEQVNTSQAAAKQASIELAVFRAASDAKGDPIALLDSRAFLTAVNGVDPSDTAAITAAITAAVAENPRLGVAPGTPTGPAVKHNPLQGGVGAPAGDRSAQIATAEAAGDFKTAIRLKAQQSVVLPTPV